MSECRTNAELGRAGRGDIYRAMQRNGGREQFAKEAGLHLIMP